MSLLKRREVIRRKLLGMKQNKVSLCCHVENTLRRKERGSKEKNGTWAENGGWVLVHGSAVTN